MRITFIKYHISRYDLCATEINPIFKWDSCCSVSIFYVVSTVLIFICLSFLFLAMKLSVCFRFMSLDVPLVYFAPLLCGYRRYSDFKCLWYRFVLIHMHKHMLLLLFSEILIGTYDENNKKALQNIYLKLMEGRFC